MFNFVYLRSSRLNFWHFWLDSCIVKKGEKFELEMACCTHLEGFQVVLSYFWALQFPRWHRSDRWGHRSDRCSSQVLGNLVHRSDPWGWPVWPVRTELMQLLGFMRWFACIHLGGVALVQGDLACVQGSSLWFSSFGLVVCALCLSMILSRMCRAIALA
jgi:hypothetical protein